MKNKIKIIGSVFIIASVIISYVVIRNQKKSTTTNLRTSISLAGKYLERQILPDGEFVYRINMNSKIKMKQKYNILRHMGAIYSLNMLEDYKKGSVDQKKIKKSLEYIMEKTFKPVEPNMLGVWSSEELSGQKGMKDQVKLGAVGLSLVALCQSYELIKEKISIQDLEKLGDFLLYMQKENGGFYSKYLKETGRDDTWTSLYYPGEAAFGLVELYKLTNNKKYLESATKAILFLYNERKDQSISKVPADHWALIASDKILLNDSLISHEDKNHILDHAQKVVKSMLLSRVLSHKVTAAIGGFTQDGRTTPTATRVEGLTAIYKHLTDEQTKSLTRDAIMAAANFLQRAQVISGKYAGAMPRSILTLAGKDRGTESFNNRATEVRIDYVQHALSALIETTKIKTSP